ncbi:MAG: hypothetical protein COA69_00895 [Robiginitomaculum sp.]|nr:MAG: hypothetical protein COA69_00895 [Robiginitomaculum sp.]
MQFLFPILSRYGAIAVQFVVVALVTRSLSLEEAGIYFSLFGLILTSNFLAGFGLPDGLVRLCPALAVDGKFFEISELIRRGVMIGFLSIFFLMIVLGLSLVATRQSMEIVLLTSMWWCCYGVIFLSAQILVAGGKAQLGTFMFYSAINAGLLVTVVPFLIFSVDVALATVLKVTVMGAGLAAIFGLILLVREVRHLKPRQARLQVPLKAAWESGVFIATGRVVQTAIIWSPVWITGVLIGVAEAALIGLSGRLVSAVAAVIATIRFSIRPELSRSAAAGQWSAIERLARHIGLWTTLLAVVAICGDLLIGKAVISTIFGDQYGKVAGLVAILLVGTIGESFGGPVDEILKMDGKGHVVLLFQILAGVIGVGLQFLGAHMFGLKGVAVGYAFSFCSLYIGLILYLKQTRGISTLIRWEKT